MPEWKDHEAVFLSTLPAGRRELWPIRIIALVSLAAGAAVAPVAAIPMGEAWPFIPAYEAALCISDLVTAVLLLGQLPFLRSRALLVLSSGYVFTGLIQIPHMLSFPGVFSPTGLLGSGPQTTAWLYMFWHAGLPLAVIGYAALKDSASRPARAIAHPGGAIAAAIGVVIALVVGLTLAVTLGHDLLPPLMVGNTKSVPMLAGFESVWGLSFVALFVLWRKRPHSVLDLWLMAVMCAWICDEGLSSVFNAGRFDLGFYAGRVFGLIASNLVLVALIMGTTALYGRLVQSLRSTAVAQAQLDGYARRLEAEVRATDQKLQQNAEHLRHAQRVGMIGSAQVDLRTRAVIWSDEMYRLLGLDPGGGAPSAESILAAVVEEDRGIYRAALDRTLDGIDGTPIEFRIARPNGDVRWMYRSTEIVRKNGSATGAISTFQDITDRKQAADELKRTQAFLDLVIDNLPGTVVVKDAKDLRYRLWNKGSEELMGIGRDEVIGKTDRDLVPPEQAEMFQAGDRATLASGKMLFVPEETVTTRHRGTRTIQIKKVPVFDEHGEPSYLISFADDITDRKQAEAARAQAEAATSAKSSFLANMSHEIRTPMNAIIGLSDLALRTKLDAKQQDYLAKIKSSAMALLGIINDILDFSKIEAGKLRLDNIDFDLRTVLDGVAGVSALRATEKNIELLFSVDPRLPAMVIGDPLRLGQVLQNLVGNAIKFTDRGEIVVAVRVADQSSDEIVLDCAVTDTGIGMDAETLARLFQPFSQADSSTTRRFGGTGLGLTISRQLVEMMGGGITVDSKPGQGSRFSFNVKLGRSAKAGEVVRQSASALAGLRALVIDDSAAARQIIEATLGHWGMAVDSAASGADGVAAVRQGNARRNPYDLLLIDWRMPDIDGIDAARLVRAQPAAGKAPAIVMMTAYGRDDLVDKAHGINIDAFLAKPISDSTLLDTISTALFNAPKAWQPRGAAAAIEPVAPAGAHILLVDDNDINRQVGEETLTSAGFSVDLAINGQDAVDKIFDPANRYDAVLMDIQMPVMDGLQATRVIRTRFSSERLPVIALTASAMVEERQRCLDAGMDDHAAKPIEPAALIATVMRWIAPDEAKPAQASVGNAAAPAATQLIPAAAETSSAPDELPVTLPPFDIAKALVRVNGKRALVRRLIVSFGKEFDGAAQQIRRLFEDGKLVEAERAAHTLKSAAATLGADYLASASEAIERDLRQGRTESMTTLVDALDKHLAPALDAAASLRRD